MKKTVARIVVVTGAGSGIGKATAELLRSNGDEVIGVDLRGADIDVDLSNAESIAQWMRSVAPTDEFAGKGIAINAVGPSVVITPMTEEMLSTEEGRKRAFGPMPAPLNGGVKPESIAATHAFLISEANRSMTGQILYVDGGFDSTAQGRGADIWHNPRHLDDVAKGEA